ncbi:MAG: glycosyltransferase [Acidobacteriota bacterium]
MSRTGQELPELGVVIPTRDRVDRLGETLRALDEAAAKGEARLEIIVIDDGSSAASRRALADLVAARAGGVPLHVLEQPALGPATARNRGVAASRAARVLLLGDDTRPAPGALAAHRAAAEGQDRAVQGHIDWDPSHEVTPLMDFLAPAGPQFYFRGLVDGGPVPFTAVLGSNLAAPRGWLLREPFDEGFPHAAVEDTEMAWRWRRRGWPVIYSRAAVCWHHHRYAELEPFLARQRRAGASIRHAVARHPRLAWPLVLQPLAATPVVALRHVLRGGDRQHLRWDLACRRALFSGVFSGLLRRLRS